MSLLALHFALNGLLDPCGGVASAQCDNGPIWKPIEQLSHTPADAFAPEPAIVGDTVHVIYHAGWAYYRRSTDSGATWGDEILLSDSLGGSLYNRPVASSGTNVFFVFDHNDGSGSVTEIRMRRSIDAGLTWLEPEVLVSNSFANEYHSPMVTAFGEHVFVALHYRAGPPSSYFMIRSTDRGVTWDSLRQISSVPAGTWGDFRGDRYSIQLAYESYNSTEIVHASSTNDGDTWSDPQYLSAIDDHPSWGPQIVLSDPDVVFICWTDAKYGSVTGFSGTVLGRRSTDYGATWMPELRVSSLASATFSSLASGNGILHVVWDDERYGASNGTVQYSFSPDQGKTWCPDITIGDTLEFNVTSSICSSGENVHFFWSSYTYNPDTADVFYRRGKMLPTGVDWSPSTTTGMHPQLRCYPNPFNNEITIDYVLPRSGAVALGVFDILGKEAERLENGVCAPGSYQWMFRPGGLSSGVYYVILFFDDRKEVRPILLLR